jgi:putative Holliday junction resolvase
MNDPSQLATLKSRLPADGRLFGIDLGEKTIGLALCDSGLRIASAYGVLKRGKFGRDATELKRLAGKEGVGGFVVGLPLNMDGSEGPRAQASRAFARNLERALGMPVAFWDERLSTMAAERAMIEADLSRAKRARKIDAAAAAFILQGALDRMARL